MSKKIIITGGSGLLGRAVANYLQNALNSSGRFDGSDSLNRKFQIQRWVYSRIRDEKVDKKVDIAKREDVFKAMDEFQPDAIIHCAAIRAPDIVANQYDVAHGINVLGSQYVAEAAAHRNAKLIYISTDYVFDGRNPPYAEDSQPNPLNEYGQQKLDGERVVLQHCPGAVVLRVPILYGPVEFVGEGAVDVILKVILKTDTKCEMSHYERRYPTHVYDVAAAIGVLLDRHFEGATNIQGVYHWSGDEEMTKYDMARTMSEVFSLPITHLVPTADAPPNMSAAKRPFNARLSCQRLSDLGARNRYRFKEGIETALKDYVPSN